jgi:ribonuclease E
LEYETESLPPEPEDEEFGGEVIEEGEVEVAADEEGAPRRRRRRRRRRRSPDARDVRPASVAEEEELPATEPELLEEPFEPADFIEGEVDERRERRGRRRRRRSGDRPMRSEPPAVREPAESAEMVDENDVETEDIAEEEVVVRPLSYENIPTWEEAISYLLRPRGEGGHRSGPSRRR